MISLKVGNVLPETGGTFTSSLLGYPGKMIHEHSAKTNLTSLGLSGSVKHDQACQRKNICAARSCCRTQGIAGTRPVSTWPNFEWNCNMKYASTISSKSTGRNGQRQASISSTASQTTWKQTKKTPRLCRSSHKHAFYILRVIPVAGRHVQHCEILLPSRENKKRTNSCKPPQ
jgi:hypothetical protein